MADFAKYAPKLLQLEGGYSNHTEDNGRQTMMGVTIATYRAYCGQEKTVRDLQRMSYGTWEKIMKDMYWDKCLADEIVNQSVAEIVVDWCINSGMIGLRKVQLIVGVVSDGIAGPKTLAAINGAEPSELFSRIVNAREQFYIDLVKRNPKKRVFMNGWMNRLLMFKFEE